jgi:hypothetical protein
MKLVRLFSLTVCVWGCADAFAPRSPSPTRDATRLFISSWGTKGPPSRWAEAAEQQNPQTNLQSYLKEPAAVEARANLDGTCLVSGLVRSKERTDQFVFDLLNHEESAFEFNRIVALVPDAKFAKKRLLSRSARYTGLLDKLEFVQAEQGTDAAVATEAQLENVKSWVAVLDANDRDEQAQDLLETCRAIIAVAQKASALENIAILLAGANELEATACQAVVDELEALHSQPESPKTYTLVAVGALEERPEGQTAYAFADFGTPEAVLPAQAVFSREESLRFVTELLQLEAGANRALAFAEVYNQNKTEAKLVKGLRQAGYARPQEIDHMLRDGPAAYKQAIQDFLTKNPDAAKGYTTTDAWWEQDIYKQSRARTAEREVEKTKFALDERTQEVEAIAKEWAKREFFRVSMAGTVDADMTEDEFIESCWDRALFQGDLKYRQMKGEKMDEETELATFQSKQERKQKAMLERAKKELAEIMQEDLDKDDDEDDDDEDDKKKK